MRLELCFLRWEEDECGAALLGKYRMDVCCCTIGAAWGTACEACPEPESLAFTSLCPRGLGFASRDFLSGRPFYKGAFGLGEPGWRMGRGSTILRVCGVRKLGKTFVLVAEPCLTLCNQWTVTCQAPLSVGILQARILEWVAIPFSRGSS